MTDSVSGSPAVTSEEERLARHLYEQAIPGFSFEELSEEYRERLRARARDMARAALDTHEGGRR